MKRLAQSLVSIILGGVVFYLALSRFDVRRTTASIRDARPGLLVLSVLLLTLCYLIRGARWQIWERSLTYWDSLRIILIGFMGNNILPARLGEVLRAHCAASKTCSERGRTAALASIAAERILDGLILAVFGLIALALVPFDRRLKVTLLLISLALAILALALVLGIYFHERIRSLVIAANRKFPGHMTAFTRQKTIQFLEGLLPLGTLRRTIAAITATTIIWSMEVAACYFFGLAVWPTMKVSTAILFLVVVNLVSLVPFTMGGIGTIDAIAPFFLISAGVPSYLALAMVVLQHTAQYVLTTVSGGVLYLAGRFYQVPLSNAKGATSDRSLLEVHQPLIEETRSILGEFCASVPLKPALQPEIELSIVVPAYNEQSRLPRTVLETLRWCSAREINFELVIVDDGSQDETLALGRLFEESDFRIRTLACPHMGKGAAVRMGILNAKGRFILFMDADGATPPSEIPRLLSAIQDGHDIAIGSRVVQHPGEVRVKTSVHRKLIGRCFAFFVNLFAVDGIGDTQCGFKMFRREAARAIFSRQKTVGFAFDVEILFIATRLSLSIIEVPVNWTAQPNSKVNLVTDSIKMLWDVSHIRWLHRNFRAQTTVAREEQPAG